MSIKKHLFIILLLLTISFILLHNLLKPGIYYSHDGPIHIARLVQAKEAFQSGHFPLRWLGNWYYSYGYPTFVFTYSLPTYFGLGFNLLINNFEDVFKILMFLSLFLSGVTAFYFLKTYFSNIAALVGSVFYITAPYRFADIYERGSLGEALTFILLPLLFLFIKKFNHKPFGYFLPLSLLIFLFITTHAIVFIIFFVLALIYSLLIFKKSLSKYIFLKISILFGFMLSAFSWLPMIWEQKFSGININYYSIFKDHLLPINQLLRIPKVGINIGTGIQLGTSQSIITLLCLIFVIYKILRNKKIEKEVFFFLILTFLGVFLSSSYSELIYNNLKFMQTLIFPWRFLTLTTFTTCFLAAYIFNKFKNKYKYLLFPVFVLFAIMPSRHFLDAKDWQIHNNDYYLHNEDIHSLDLYYLPIGLPTDLNIRNIQSASIINGNGNIKILNKNNVSLTIEANIQSNTKIQFHSIYFPGWKLYTNNQEIPILANEKNWEKTVVGSFEKGKYVINLKFTESPVRKIADIISLLSFLLIPGYYIFYKLLTKHKKFKKLIYQGNC